MSAAMLDVPDSLLDERRPLCLDVFDVASHVTGLFAVDDDHRLPDIVVSRPANCSRRGVTEMLIVDPAPRTFDLYRNHWGTAVPVTPDEDGGVTLDTLGIRQSSVGPRLRVVADAETVDC